MNVGKLGSSAILLGILALTGALTGCDAPGFKSKVTSPDSAAKGAPVVGTTQTTGAAVGAPGAGPSLIGPEGQVPAVWSQGLSVSDAIARACGIYARGDRKQMEATFDYDSATLADDDRSLLAEVARCVSDGPLRGRRIALVGRADARGEPEYNMTLGESRADSVRRYMVDLGVGKEQMKATSRGEMDATGTDEAGYRHDRRVDLELAE